MKNKLALSTSWISWREPHAEKMIDEIKSYGFDTIELDFSLTTEMVEQILACVNRGDISVCSLHNFCPLPDDVSRKHASPNIYLISDKNPELRQKAVTATLRTIDYAVKFGAKAVVMHCGEIPLKNRTGKLIRLLERDKTETMRFAMIKSKLFRERERYRQEYMQYTLKSLDQINTYAVKNNILIGIENRYHAHEIPDLEEIFYIFTQFEGGNLYYWHDVGHAQMMENLNIFYHEEYIASFKNRIAGIHIHDIVRSSDHRAPGTGTFDFSRIAPFLRQDIVKVLEIHHPTAPSELKYGLQYIKPFLEDKPDEGNN
ncbi:MAG: TIM barrel protein [Candidatus Auribacterota bacterium]|jgi:sugar phosphate isomerase/epimerase|nr:TIM barrel protein [Candidatus Auribacterota bacterium]